MEPRRQAWRYSFAFACMLSGTAGVSGGEYVGEADAGGLLDSESWQVLEGADVSFVAPAGCILPSSADAIMRPDCLSVICLCAGPSGSARAGESMWVRV